MITRCNIKNSRVQLGPRLGEVLVENVGGNESRKTKLSQGKTRQTVGCWYGELRGGRCSQQSKDQIKRQRTVTGESTLKDNYDIGQVCDSCVDLTLLDRDGFTRRFTTYIEQGKRWSFLDLPSIIIRTKFLHLWFQYSSFFNSSLPNNPTV